MSKIDYLSEVKPAGRVNLSKFDASLEDRVLTKFEGGSASRLSLATMFVQSNDLFYAPEERGIGLFDGEKPLSGDVTIALGLWDAGTEQNEEPGVGENQAPRQMEVGAGMDEDAPVRLVTDVGDGYSYPYTSAVIRVTREVEMG